MNLLKVGIGVALVLILLVVTFEVFENLDADEIMVIQSPISGELVWHVTAGVKWQGFGKITTYPKRAFYEFAIPVRFNDGGHATMEGSIQYEMPLDREHLTALHVKFGSREAIQKQLIETVVNKSVYMTGPLMSSKESYAERRNDLIRFVEDQVVGGVYRTAAREARIKDALTGADKTITLVEIVMSNGAPDRQETAILPEYGIHPFNFSITRLPYDETVEAQIKGQQGIAMDVQTAIAESKKAEQRTITIAEQGKAKVMEAKYAQEVERATEVTAAQKRLDVATLDAKAAEETKRKEILLGEGEGKRKQLVMQADGALEKKLAALVEINKVYAQAMKDHAGSWVPQIVMGQSGQGGSSSTPGGAAIPLIDLLTAKTARDLGIDLKVIGQDKTGGR